MQAGYLKAVAPGVGGPTLPSGTYTPKLTGLGGFNLQWLSPTANVTAGNGKIEKNSGGGAWDGSSYFIIDHTGDFTLSFVIDFSVSGSNIMFGLDYYKATNSYEHLDFCFYRSSLNASIFEAGAPVYSHVPLVNDTTVYTIQRSGSTIIYKIDGTTVRTVNITSIYTINVDCSLNDLGIVKNIQVIIP